MWPVAATEFLKTRVSPDIKHRVQQAASQQLITESIWLKRLVIQALSEPARSNIGETGSAGSVEPSSARDSRLYVRLRHEDRLLLRERAAARGMAAATYVSVLVRSHLRNVAPLPKEELSALKRLVAELGAIGRNMNQIARAAPGGPDRQDLWAMLKVAEALRDHVKALLKANLTSWRDSNGGPFEATRLLRRFKSGA